MKVLHVIPSLSIKHGGPSVALPLMARSLVGSGVQLDVATTDDDGPGCRLHVPLGRRLERDGYGVFHFRKQTEFYKVSLSFARWLRRHVADYDVVHIHALFSFTSVSAARCARRCGVPYLIRPLGVLNEWGLRHRRPWLKSLSMRFVEGPMLRHAAAMHYTSRQEQIQAERAVAVARPIILPLDIDIRQFEHLPGPGLFLERFPQAAGRDVVLFLSRLDPKKGLDLLLRAFVEVRRSHANSLLVIAGSGRESYEKELRACSAALGLDGDVLWTGFLGGADKLSAMSVAALFVLPSYSENFGIALVEAMAAGLPSVVTENVAASDLVREHEAGLVIPAEVPALASALGRLLEDKNLRAKSADNARRFASQNFSREKMGVALRGYYGQIISEKKAVLERAGSFDGRNCHLDVLRAAAIVMVVAYHLIQMSPKPLPALMRLARSGEYGVDLFFVLSGWLIGSLYWKESACFGKVDLLRFWARRWMRTIPPYLVALLLAWLAVRVDRHEPFNWGYLVFIQNYYKTIPYFLVSWSLCIEEHFYLFLPMLLTLAGRSKTSLTFQFTLLILLAPICRCLMPSEALSAPFGFAHTATHMRMEGLLMGFWAAWLPIFSPPLWLSFKRLSPLAIGVSAIILTTLAFLPSLWMYRVGLTVLALGLIGVLVWMTDKRPGTMAKAKVIHAVAVSSYSVYLTHALMLHVAQKLLAVASSLPWYTYFPMALVLVSAGGAVFYFAVERTSIQLRDRWAARRKGVVIGVPTVGAETTHV